MTKLIAAAALLASSLAARADGDICWGQPVKEVTAITARNRRVIGTEPNESHEIVCGGGRDENNEPIPKWTCFQQFWATRGESGAIFVLLLSYSHSDGAWRLADARMCRDGHCVLVPDINPCPAARPDAQRSSL